MLNVNDDDMKKIFVIKNYFLVKQIKPSRVWLLPEATAKFEVSDNNLFDLQIN